MARNDSRDLRRSLLREAALMWTPLLLMVLCAMSAPDGEATVRIATSPPIQDDTLANGWRFQIPDPAIRFARAPLGLAQDTSSQSSKPDKPESPKEKKGQAGAGQWTEPGDPPGTTAFEGRVVDEKGVPVVGAEVAFYAYRLVPPGKPHPANPEGNRVVSSGSPVKTDEKGEFRAGAVLDSLDIRDGKIFDTTFVQVKADGYATRHEPVKAVPGAKTRGIEVVLDRGKPVSGTVRTKDSKPVVGAFVALCSFEVPSDSTMLDAKTDSQGKFVFKHLGDGPYSLLAGGEGTGYEFKRIDGVRGGSAGVEIVLSPGN